MAETTTKTRKSSKSKAAADATVNAPQTTSEPQATATEQTANAPPVVSAPIDTSTVQTAAENATVNAEAVREQSVTILANAITSFRKGEAGYRAGLLETGRLLSDYYSLRLSLGDRRDGITQTAEGQLAAYASAPVSCHRLLSAWHAFRLLAMPNGITVDSESIPPYGYFAEFYSTLTERRRDVTNAEVWQLRDGIADEATALFAECSANGINRDGVREKCQALARKADSIQREKLKAEAEASREKEAAKLKAEQEAAADRKEAERKAKEAAAELERSAAIENAEERARIAAKAEHAKQELLDKQRAELQLAAERAEAERERLRNERREKDALEREKADAERKAAAERRKNGEKPQAAVPSAPTRESFLKMGSEATAKDAADMAVGFILENKNPADTLEQVIRSLDKSGKLLGTAAGQACKAFIMTISRLQANAAEKDAAKHATEAIVSAN